MIDKEQDLEPARVRWERRQMMMQLFSATALLWACRKRPERWLAAAVWVNITHSVFKDTKGRTQSFGPVFWYHERQREIKGQYTQRYNMTRRIEWRAMFEDDVPHRVGKGLALRLWGKLYMVGYCRRRPPQEELFDKNGMLVDFWEYEAAE